MKTKALTSSTKFGLAPNFRRIPATSLWPCWMASINGVSPSCTHMYDEDEH